MAQHIQRDATVSGPDLRSQNADHLPTQACPSTVSHYEELAQIDLLGFISKPRIPGQATLILKEDCRITAPQPFTHALLKLADAHRIAMPFVLNQLLIQFAEQRAVILA